MFQTFFVSGDGLPTAHPIAVAHRPARQRDFQIVDFVIYACYMNDQ
jgi:hypothetical protein